MMMNNGSFITDKINSIFSASQEFLRPLVCASLFLQRFDYFILFLTVLLLLLSLFTQTMILGKVALLIIGLSVLKIFFIRGQTIKFSTANLVLFLYLGICFISVLFSPYLNLSFKGFFKTFVYVAFYFSMVHFFRFNKNKIVPLIFIIVFLNTIESVIALMQSFNNVEAIATWQDTSYTNAEDILSRVYGTLKPYNPNLLCGYLVVGLSSVITVGFWAFIGKHKKTFLFALLSFLITLVAIFKTGTRGGYLGVFAMFSVAFLLIYMLSKKHFSKNMQELWKKICAGIVALGGMAIILTPKILKRVLSIFMLRGDSSTSFRMNVYHSTWNMFLDNWFTGIGVGNETFRNMYGLYMITGFDALSAYSIYLEIAVESGIFALLIFLLFFGMLIKSSINFINNDFQIEQKVIVISILIMITGVFVHGFVDTIFFRPQLQFLFWTNIAMLSVILDENKNENAIHNNIQQVIMKLSNVVTDKVKKIKGV
ncbi:O-antigen ligase family protein [bacterium]|nr:O-antigen ligase family protein [bacterium]